MTAPLRRGITENTSMTGPIALARKHAIRRRAMKRLLRAHGVPISSNVMYDETALRKLVRDKVIKQAEG